MRRAAGLLLLPVLLVAVPVPKVAPKIEDVFGERTTPNSRHTCEMDERSRLTLTVPTQVKRVEPLGRTDITLPLLAREFEGDFRVTVRVGVGLPVAGTADVKAFKAAAVAVGLSVYATDKTARGATFQGVWEDDGKWSGTPTCCYATSGSRGRVEAGTRWRANAVVLFRVTRRGDQLTGETSEDGTKWEDLWAQEVKGLPATVKVGPVAFGCIDQEFTATFDQYEITPLAKDEKK